MNELQNENSPYLIQHADNPVDWLPWGEKAFSMAKEMDRPIFLSIGYSTCHWCHVMAEESFEDQEVAELINNTFVPIKVDREERPDIDTVYMKAAVLATGKGGWPLTIIMTPEKIPFFAATYIPKEARYGMIGLKDLVRSVDRMWKEERGALLESSSAIHDAVRSLEQESYGKGPELSTLEKCIRVLSSSYDEINGGFGSSPKFPSPHQLVFMLRFGRIFGKDEAVKMALETLRGMRKGGIYDHVGGGFHRYSTDEKWHLPHFEKMLYDQATHIMAYAEAYEITGERTFKDTVEEVASYLLDEMRDQDGGFHSAEDADSEGEEGTYYIWTLDEIISALGETEGKRFAAAFGITGKGNFREESTGRRTGSNVLHIENGEEYDKRSLLHLKSIREQRVRPGRDDKVLTDWNSIAITALTRAFQVTSDKRYLDAAREAAGFLLDSMFDERGELYHSYRKGSRSVPALLDDHSFLGNALLDLYETTFDIRYLKKGLEMVERMNTSFLDRKNGGYFSTSEGGEELLFRPKDPYDGAMPSGNSAAFHLLIRASRLTGRADLEEKAVDLYRSFGSSIKKHSTGHTWMLAGALHLLGPSKQIVIVGPKEDIRIQEMIGIIKDSHIPNRVVLLKGLDGELDEIAPFTKDAEMIDGRPTAFVCEGWNCDVPTNDIEIFREQLSYH